MQETFESMSEERKKTKSGCQKRKEKKLAQLQESASKSRNVKSYFAKVPAAIHSSAASASVHLETDELLEGEIAFFFSFRKFVSIMQYSCHRILIT